MSHRPVERTLGLTGATIVGVGAIVGGGVLALAGVAFSTTGPSAILAFGLNGLIALVTALSFAELAAAFPESGGTYTFAKKVLSVEAAFGVGWVVWFASIVAAVLYALGFASYGAIVVQELWRLAGEPPAWIAARPAVLALALGATVLYTLSLVRKSTGGGQWATIGKVVVFVVLIAGGAWALAGRPAGTVRSGLTPFFHAGGLGLFQAMGYTFIALQGFDLIAAVGGEIREPTRNLPRSMILSLGIGLAVYLPLLLVISTVGVPAGETIVGLSAAQPETVVAVAVEGFLGPVGYWLVLVAAVLSMLSALHANLLAASRVAMAMARDRTMPARLGQVHPERGTPVDAVLVTAGTVAVILLVIPDLAAAGAVSSLIFLISFALAHWIAILVRQRGGKELPFRLPWFPAIPVVGALACGGLAIFQGVAVPSAGALAAVWLAIGGVLFLTLFADRARVVDAQAEALDPELVRLRGRNPLVLVPIANPASAEGLVGVASALVPRDVGRVLLFSVVQPPKAWQPGHTPRQLVDAQSVLGESLTASFAAALAPEALITVSAEPWREIARVSRLHRCESLLLGLGKLTDDFLGVELEALMSGVDTDVVVLRAPPGWRLDDVRDVLVPIGGRRDQSDLRARLLGSLTRAGDRRIAYLGVFPGDAGDETLARARQDYRQLANDEAPGHSRVEIVRGRVVDEMVRRADQSDLLVLGLKRLGRRRKVLGDLALQVARRTDCPMVMISRRG